MKKLFIFMLTALITFTLSINYLFLLILIALTSQPNIPIMTMAVIC